MSIQRDVSIVHDETRPVMAPPTLPDPTPDTRAGAVMTTLRRLSGGAAQGLVDRLPNRGSRVRAIPLPREPTSDCTETCTSMKPAPDTAAAMNSIGSAGQKNGRTIPRRDMMVPVMTGMRAP